ncbi:putative electron transfer flavoprotein subunit [Mortierella alpina]|nr:putative electron transfer flavoprotein subunit [Mortierella alpina]
MVSITSPPDANAGATHLQLLLQQHHALQRQEQEARERRDREQQQLRQIQERSASAATNSSSSSTAPSLSDLKADAQSVAAYMAAYLRVASAGTDRTRGDQTAACLTIDPAKTSFAAFMTAPSAAPPATISPSSTLLHSSPPPPSTEFMPAASTSPKLTSQKACAKPTKSSPPKKPSFSPSDAAAPTTTAAAAVATEVASEGKSNHHRQECYNCGVTKTPLWRRTHDRLHSLCNACGLYYKQYKSNRPLVARPKDQGAESSFMTVGSEQGHPQQLEQQSKRRKVEDGGGEGLPDGSGIILVKNEPSEASQQKHQDQYASNTTTSTFKLLLPHPPTRQPLPQFSIPQTSTTSSRQLLTRALDAEREDEYVEDQDEDSLDADMESDSKGADEAHHERVDVDMTDGQLEHQSSDDSESDSNSDDDNEDHQHSDGKIGIQESDEASSKQDPDKKASSLQTGPIIECANCGQTQTPLWRKDAKGQSICNACGLYARLHHRDRPVTMRKTKIARRKRDWSAAQEKMTANKSGNYGINGGGDNVGHAASCGTKSKKERKTSKAPHVEVRAMNIPVNTEHELDDSTICLLDQGAEEHVSCRRFTRYNAHVNRAYATMVLHKQNKEEKKKYSPFRFVIPNAGNAHARLQRIAISHTESDPCDLLSWQWCALALADGVPPNSRTVPTTLYQHRVHLPGSEPALDAAVSTATSGAATTAALYPVLRLRKFALAGEQLAVTLVLTIPVCAHVP